MSLKYARLLVISTAILAACPLYFPGQSLFGPVGPLTYSGPEPIVASPQYDPDTPRIVEQARVDLHLNGWKVAPTGGAGMRWRWHF
ncbi:MAG: hypothetical protein P4L43_10415 [Syntrophobacteraceae bacterium]|nr:hypothetical protein [Syntrophobacteraceae bacterium]